MSDYELPDGATCEDCINFKRCTLLINVQPDSTECDWIPSRFQQSAVWGWCALCDDCGVLVKRTSYEQARLCAWRHRESENHPTEVDYEYMCKAKRGRVCDTCGVEATHISIGSPEILLCKIHSEQWIANEIRDDDDNVDNQR